MDRRMFFAASAAGIAAGVLPGVEMERQIEPTPENVAKLHDLIVAYYTPIFAEGFAAALRPHQITGSGRIS